MRRQERYLQIARTLSRHGLDHLVDVLDLQRWLPAGLTGGLAAVAPVSVLRERHVPPRTGPERLRAVMEDLGATFVKLGQIVSTRPDLLPPDYQRELTRLQSEVSPVPWEAVRATVESELGAPLEELFEHVDPKPLASASIGQAHAATLPDGTAVVVKVRRPGVVEQVQGDLEVLRDLAARASRRWSIAADYDVVGLAQDFADTLRAELDYLQEGRNADRFAHDFAGDPEVHVPKVHWDRTTSRVITLERLRGVRVSDGDALDAAGIDRPALAARATRIVADMVFVHGFFHADPHPGNLLIGPGGEIGLLDHGMVGEVDERTRLRLAALVAAFVRHDADRVASAVTDIALSRGRVDRRRLADDAARLLARYQGLPLSEISIGAYVRDVLAILRAHRMTLPRNLALVVRMVVMLEGMGAELDPRFHLGEVLAPYVRRLMAHQLGPTALARRLGRVGLEAAELGAELPGQLLRILDDVERDGLSVSLRTDELESYVRRVERIGNRVVVGVVTAAVIEGLAELAAVDPPRWQPHQTKIVGAGVAAAAALTGYLGWTARGRRPSSRW
ncbi:ABC1 kinase family protein [Kineococcus terrestris]|uniref:ABC1 kinase family protein n=1 Tax=Kineococcus terrestris TaxID=2044856 RepID=UPI0034DB4568